MYHIAYLVTEFCEASDQKFADVPTISKMSVEFPEVTRLHFWGSDARGIFTEIDSAFPDISRNFVAEVGRKQS